MSRPPATTPKPWLATTKNHPSDATLADFCNLRAKVNKAAFNGRLSAYYLDSPWEVALPAFRTAAEPNVFIHRPDSSAFLDGYPIIWTDVLEPYSTDASADKPGRPGSHRAGARWCAPSR